MFPAEIRKIGNHLRVLNYPGGLQPKLLSLKGRLKAFKIHKIKPNEQRAHIHNCRAKYQYTLKPAFFDGGSDVKTKECNIHHFEVDLPKLKEIAFIKEVMNRRVF
jgi:hypothetical protein